MAFGNIVDVVFVAVEKVHFLSHDSRLSTIGKNGSNFGNFTTGNGQFCADLADRSANSAAMLAMGLPPPRLPKTKY